MGGLTKVVIIKNDGSVLSGETYTGNLNDMIFSKEFCEGKFDEAIDKLKKGMSITNTISPIGYGITLVDMPNKTIHDMQGYDSTALTMLSQYGAGDRDFKYLMENNLVNIIDRVSKNKFTVQDLFGSVDFNKIKKILKTFFNEEEIDSNIKLSMFAQRNHQLYLAITPAIIDFKVINYENTGIVSLASTLIDNNISFNQKEISEWIEFAKEDFYDDLEDLQNLFNSLVLNNKLNKNLIDKKNKISNPLEINKSIKSKV